MSARSSVASRLLACLIAVLLVGAGIAGAAAAVAPVSGTTELDSDGDSLEESTTETDDDLENTTNDTTTTIENTTEDTEETVEEPDDDLEESTTTTAVEDTTDEFENSIDESTDDLEDSTDDLEETTNEPIDDSVSDPLEPLEGTTSEPTESLEDSISDPIDSLTGGVTETVGDAASDPITFLDDAVNDSVGTVEALPGPVASELEASAEHGADSSEDADANRATDGDSDDSSAGMSTATDAVLIGLLGAITASGAAASGASASAGAGASAGTGAGAGESGGAGAAGGAGGLLARWLSQAGELRHLRRAGSVLPWELGPLFGYSRYDDSDPLENDRRRTIYGTIRAKPGCYLSQVSEESDVALSTVRHHVRVLEEEGLVTTAKINGKRRYFLADSERPTGTMEDGAFVGSPELHAALEEPARRDVLETLAELGPVSNGRLAEELERHPSTVSHHLSALETAGLVVREQDGRSVLNELASTVEDALRDAAPSVEEDSAESSASAPADD